MQQLAARLKQAHDHVFPAPVEAWEHFVSFCQPKSFPREEILKASGETERYGYFILDGSMGAFLHPHQTEVCLDLAYENNFFGDYMSLITAAPSPLEIRTIEPCNTLQITRDNIDLLKATPFGQLIFMASAESSFVDKQRQQIDLLTKTASQRYKELLERQPNVVLRTPQKYIASYLGITPQSFSRIRRTIR